MRPQDRFVPDQDPHHERARNGPCFACGVVNRDRDLAGHRGLHEDDRTIAFFNSWPTRRGHTLVAPKEHREQATGDFAVEEYLELQGVIHRVSEALREEVGAERMYVLSLGSNQGNAHVHWHVVPLPPGTPYEEQQFAALMLETAGALEMPEREKAALAGRVRRRLERA